MQVRVKICGITRLEDAQVAVDAGSAALGFQFASDSRRCIEPERAAAIIARLPAFVTSVGLFIDPQPEAVRAVLEAVPVDLLQFHGSESASLCRSFDKPYIKAVSVDAGLDLARVEENFADARALLFDSTVDGRFGGTGATFDWALWPEGGRIPKVLAGGLNPDNVAGAIRRTRPYAVDVAGGVEAGDPGVKDPSLIRRFIEEVQRV